MAKKIALIGAYPYNGNKGVGALAISTLQVLSELANQYKVGFDIYLINPEYGDRNTDILNIGSENVQVTNLYPMRLFGIKDVLRLLLRPQTKRTYKMYRHIEYVMNIGAGDSFADIYGKDRFFTFNDQNRLALLFGKRLALLPQTIGPFNDKSVKKAAIKTIEACQIVLARDTQSYRFLKDETKQANIDELIDVAFFMPYERQTFTSDFINIGLNISALLWNGGYTRNNQFGLKSDYKILIYKIIEYFISIPNVKIHLVPHVISINYDVENDYAVSYDVEKEYKSERIILSPMFMTPIFAKNYISGLDFFAGARMHACIAAFSTGIPVYPMGYSRKFNGLFNDTLNYNYFGDMVNLGEQEILSGIKKAFEKRDELKEIIQQRMNTVVAERGKLLKRYLIDFLELNKDK